jgi:hypothetical protein
MPSEHMVAAQNFDLEETSGKKQSLRTAKEEEQQVT